MVVPTTKDILHVIEWMEKRLDEMSWKLHEVRKICLERVVNVIILICGNLEVLLKLIIQMLNVSLTGKHSGTYLEQILLITQTLLFLVPQFSKWIIESIIIDQLMIAFGDALPDQLEDSLKLFYGCNNSWFDELEFRGDRRTKFVERSWVRRSVCDGCLAGGMLALQVILATHRREYKIEMVGETNGRSEEGWEYV